MRSILGGHVLLFLFAAGCGSSEPPLQGTTGVAPSATAKADPAPASSTSAAASDGLRVTGTFRGKAFASKSALARRDPNDPTKKDFRVWIVDTAATCDNLAPASASSAITVQKLPADTRFVSATIPWEVGAKREVANYVAGLHYVDADGNELGGAAQSGSIEVVEAPQPPGAKGRLRIEVRAKDSELGGTVEAIVCP